MRSHAQLESSAPAFIAATRSGSNRHCRAACPHADCATETTIADYRLGPGDQVHVTVHDREELRAEFTVDGEGYFGMPLSIDVRAGGLPAQELESALARRFAQSGVPRVVSARILRYRPVWLLDLPVAYEPGMTVDVLLARHAPPAYAWSGSEWLIARGKCSFRAAPDTELLPDDAVTLGERFF